MTLSTDEIRDRLIESYQTQRTTLLDEAETLTRAETIEGDNLDRFETIEHDIAELDDKIKKTTLLRAVGAESGDGAAGTAPNVNTRGKDPHRYAYSGPLNAVELRAAARDAVGLVEGVAETRAAVIGAVLDVADEREARLQLAKSDPHYVTAFAKQIRTPHLPNLLTPEESEAVQRAEHARAALDLGTSGSILVPTAIDPSFILTNAGAGPGSIRSVARQITISTSTWKGVTSAGVTASMDAELDEVSDDTPTVAAASADLKSARAYVEWSIEVEQDLRALMGELSMAIGDARTRLEDAQLATGTGAGNEVPGWITALDGTASEDTTPATAEAFTLPDTFNLQATLPTRFAASESAAWVMHTGTGLDLRELAMAQNSANSVWTDIGAGKPSLLNGLPVVYSDQPANSRSIDAAVTATNTGVLTVGDWSRFVIVDHSAGMLLELIPQVIGANRRPIGARGLFAMWRFGCKVVDINAFRMLSVPTTL